MGGGGNSGPTLQQQQEMTQQGLTEANLNLEENSQRKSILNSLQGTRVFKGSALSRAVRGNTPGTGGEQNSPAPSATQTASNEAPIAVDQASLLDTRQAAASGATGAGGAGASAATATAARVGAYGGGGSSRGGGLPK